MKLKYKNNIKKFNIKTSKSHHIKFHFILIYIIINELVDLMKLNDFFSHQALNSTYIQLLKCHV